MLRTGILALLGILAFATTARAQAALGGCNVWVAEAQDKIGINQNHYKLLRDVRVECNDMLFFADEAEIFHDADRVNASGNVLFVTNNNRISADRMEFNTKTRTGTFYVASGIASLENRGIDRSLFGTQEPDAYFWGKTIEKLGPKTYRITGGGFTTCVQPTPRWEMTSGSTTLTLEEHAVLKNTVLKVKGVPMMYLPVFYYPINKEDRATGFLIPTYGASTIKGQVLSNAFFWAINRSQDATFYHDFMSKTGQQYGAEYRYVQAPGAQGNIQYTATREHATEYEQPDGSVRPYAGENSFRVNGTMTQPLGRGFRLAGNADYFSSLAAQQRNQQNLYAATSTTRRFGVNVSGNWAGFTLNSAVDRNETLSTGLNGISVSNVYGSAPRVIASRGEKPIGKLPVYFGVTTDYSSILRSTDPGTTPEAKTDSGLTRVDFLPTLRFPFTRWQFLTFNSAMSWRATYWTESLAEGSTTQNIDDPVGRRYFDLSTRITGPVFTRVFTRTGGGYADKFKHVVEPFVNISHITETQNFNRIVKIDGTDFVLGTTRVTYGLNNRLYAKKGTSREILSVGIQQFYSSNQEATRYDPSVQTGYNNATQPSHLSPITLLARTAPAQGVDATFRTEYNTDVHALITLTANGTLTRGWVQTTNGWSLRRFVQGYNTPASASHYLNSSTTVRKPGNSVGGTYMFNYDLVRHAYLQSRYIAYYNSQCCGLALEYQTYNYGNSAAVVGIPQDRRFNLSFTLAGIGTFSNLFGAFGGQTR